MKFTPSSMARWRTRRHSSGGPGSPQIPRPVSCIAPKPSRFTVSSPPMSKVPDAATSAQPYACHHDGHMRSDRFTASGFPGVDDARDAERYVDYLDAQAATPFWQAAKRASIDALELPHGSTALDVGCGTGEEGRRMAATAGVAGGGGGGGGGGREPHLRRGGAAPHGARVRGALRSGARGGASVRGRE